MKNLLLSLALVFSGALFSQEKTEIPLPATSKQKFSLGMLAGLNINYMPYRPKIAIEGGSFNENVLLERAFFAGVSARQPISKWFAVKMDAQIAVKGYGIKINTFFIPVMERYQGTYLEFVPQVEYNVFGNIYLSLGGYGGVRMEERIKQGTQDWFKFNPKFFTMAKGTDWGFATGLRAEFDRVSILIKYQQGLVPAITLGFSDGFDMTTEADQFHHSLQIGLGFKML